MSPIENLDPSAFRPLAPAAAREVIGGLALAPSQTTLTRVIDGYGSNGEPLYGFMEDPDPTA